MEGKGGRGGRARGSIRGREAGGPAAHSRPVDRRLLAGRLRACGLLEGQPCPSHVEACSVIALRPGPSEGRHGAGARRRRLPSWSHPPEPLSCAPTVPRAPRAQVRPVYARRPATMRAPATSSSRPPPTDGLIALRPGPECEGAYSCPRVSRPALDPRTRADAAPRPPARADAGAIEPPLPRVLSLNPRPLAQEQDPTEQRDLHQNSSLSRAKRLVALPTFLHVSKLSR